MITKVAGQSQTVVPLLLFAKNYGSRPDRSYQYDQKCKQCSTQHRRNISSQLNLTFEEELVHNNGSDDEHPMETLSKEIDIFSNTTGNSQQTNRQDWFEAKRTPREKLNAAMRILSDSFEPLQSQLTNEWNTLSTSMKSYYSRKAQECVHLILSIIAPGQETFLLDSIQKKFTRNSEKLELDSVTKSVIDAYNKVTDSRTQTQILSVIVNNFTKTDLQKLIPGLIVFKIDSTQNMH